MLDPEGAKFLRHFMISLYHDYISLLFSFLCNFWVKYQKSSIGFENLAHLYSTTNKCNDEILDIFSKKNPMFFIFKEAAK